MKLTIAALSIFFFLGLSTTRNPFGALLVALIALAIGTFGQENFDK